MVASFDGNKALFPSSSRVENLCKSRKYAEEWKGNVTCWHQNQVWKHMFCFLFPASIKIPSFSNFYYTIFLSNNIIMKISFILVILLFHVFYIIICVLGILFPKFFFLSFLFRANKGTETIRFCDDEVTAGIKILEWRCRESFFFWFHFETVACNCHVLKQLQFYFVIAQTTIKKSLPFAKQARRPHFRGTTLIVNMIFKLDHENSLRARKNLLSFMKNAARSNVIFFSHSKCIRAWTTASRNEGGAAEKVDFLSAAWTIALFGLKLDLNQISQYNF